MELFLQICTMIGIAWLTKEAVHLLLSSFLVLGYLKRLITFCMNDEHDMRSREWKNISTFLSREISDEVKESYGGVLKLVSRIAAIVAVSYYVFL